MKISLVVGFSGTRQGMTPEQKASFLKIARRFKNGELHHGDCIGADAEAHALWRKIAKGNIVIHPPKESDSRANLEGDDEYAPEPYLDARYRILFSCNAYVVAPRMDYESDGERSGTWEMVRAARTLGKPVYIIAPSGEIIEEWERL